MSKTHDYEKLSLAELATINNQLSEQRAAIKAEQKKIQLVMNKQAVIEDMVKRHGIETVSQLIGPKAIDSRERVSGVDNVANSLPE